MLAFKLKEKSVAGCRRNVPNKGRVPQVTLYSHGEKLRVFPLRSRTWARMPPSALIFSVVPVEVPARAVRQHEETEACRSEWEKQLLFSDDTILYREKPKEFVKKLSELINDFSKVAAYKINTQKSIVFLYANGEHLKKK